MLLLALLAPATAPAVSPLHSISVYGEGDSGTPLAVFAKAKCTRKASKGGKSFEARSTSLDGRSKLFLTIPNFEGFKKEYEIEQGYTHTDPYVDVYIDEGDKGGTTYSSRYEPPAPIPTIGRALFREAGHLLGIGFGPAMFENEHDRAIDFTGVIECEKPKKGKKGKS
jgi:hypothetical protein